MKYIPTFEEFVNESALVESSHEEARIVSTDKYALVEEGGPVTGAVMVSTKNGQGKIIETSDDKAKLQEKAKNLRKLFGKGYVSRAYYVIDIPAYAKKELHKKYGN